MSTLFVIFSDISIYLKILVLLLVYCFSAYSFFAIRRYAIAQLRTSTNIVEAIVNGDFSLRANVKESKGVLAEFNLLLNGLTQRLSKQSLISREQQILLTKIISQIDVAIVACDAKHNISLMNPAAEKLFSTKQHDVMGWPIKQLGLHPVLEDGFQQANQITLPKQAEKVLVRKDNYFENGEKNTLIFITHIQHILREEERKAWQSLLRVLSHEINNSLAPIASIAQTLVSIDAKKDVIQKEHKQDYVDGLKVIEERAISLNHFIQNYHRLAKLPEPVKSLSNLGELIQHTISLFHEIDVTFQHTDIKLMLDKEQIQQALVNLIKNADEANRIKSSSSRVDIVCSVIDQNAIIEIKDYGSGIKNPDNVFVPYYSTKKTGNGIGLALSRQIIRNHNGELSLRNAEPEGAVAKLVIPLR